MGNDKILSKASGSITSPQIQSIKNDWLFKNKSEENILHFQKILNFSPAKTFSKLKLTHFFT